MNWNWLHNPNRVRNGRNASQVPVTRSQSNNARMDTPLTQTTEAGIDSDPQPEENTLPQSPKRMTVVRRHRGSNRTCTESSKKQTRGPCRRAWIKVEFDAEHGRATKHEVNFDIDLKDPYYYRYMYKLMANHFKEFKCELHDYFLSFLSPEEAIANPPIEMDGRPGQWKLLFEHFQSDPLFLRQSRANKINRRLRPYEHHAGSRLIGYLVEKKGSKFPLIDAYLRAYGGKTLNITDPITKAKYDEMVAKRDEYIKELLENNPEDTPLEDIIDENMELEIVRNVLGSKGQEFRGIGVGQFSKLKKGSSLRVRHLEEQLAAEKAEREKEKAEREKEKARREKSERRLGQMENSLRQLVELVPGFIPTTFDDADEEENDVHV